MPIVKDDIYYATKLAAAIERYNKRVELTPSYSVKWRQHSAYKYWAIGTIRRDDMMCRVCQSKEKLHAHHVKHATYSPELRFDIDNGVTLCYTCHMVLHNKLAGGYRKKCDSVHLDRLFYIASEYHAYLDKEFTTS